jgi:hypothetical protein
MVHGDDLLLREIARLVDPRMFGEIGWRGSDDAADFTDPHGDHRRIRQMCDAQGDIDALVHQVHKPVEQIEPR